MTTPEPVAADVLDDDAEDTAAELDAEPDDAEDDDPEESELDLFTGVCVGGPYNGQTETSRFPSGFLLADRPNGRAWIYDWAGAGSTFQCRSDGPAGLSTEGRLRAAEEETYDVIAYDEERVTR